MQGIALMVENKVSLFDPRQLRSARRSWSSALEATLFWVAFARCHSAGNLPEWLARDCNSRSCWYSDECRIPYLQTTRNNSYRINARGCSCTRKRITS
jgi:hypothetical protein